MTNPRKSKKVEIRPTIRLYWSFLKPYKWLFLVLVVAILIWQSLFIVDRYLFKILIDQGSLFASKSISSQVFLLYIKVLAISFITVVLARIGLRYGIRKQIRNLEGNISFDFKKRFFNHIISLSNSFHSKNKPGSLIVRMSRGEDSIEDITDFFLQLAFPFIIQIVIVSLSIFYFDKISAIVVIGVTIVFTIYGLFIQNLQRKATLSLNNTIDKEKDFIAGSITNIDSIKYFGKDNFIKENYFGYGNSSLRALLKHRKYYEFMTIGNMILMAIGVLLVIYFPLRQFLVGAISIGTVAFIYTSYLSFYGTVGYFVRNLRQFYKFTADFHSIIDYFKVKNEIKDSPNSRTMEVIKGEINFKDISFSYNKRKIIKNLNLEIKPGEKLALVGHSGSGKTTLVKLLYRLYDVDKGEILIDNNNITEYKQESLRSELSIVPQECVLFNDSIYNNVKFSNPKASREQVLKAIKFAQLDKFIENLPKKENTIVGERGIKLSGGEKQRVSIARALLADKKIIVLDEATSSLDSQTEHEIQNDLENLLKGRTSIIIAHRLSTIMKADKIVVLNKGKIVQAGTHRSLINEPGLYRKLWNLQKGGYIGE